VKALPTFWPRTRLRLTALFLALVCLGISGGVTLEHADSDGASLRTFHAGRSVLSHSQAAPESLPCVACQWENAAFDSQVPAVPFVRPVLVLMPLPAVSPETGDPHTFDHTSPRAPPHPLA